MKRFVVSQLSLYDNELTSVEVYADNWQEAVAECGLEFVLEGPGATDLDAAKEIAFNDEILFEVILIE